MKAKEFEYKGQMASLKQHCEREGVLVNGFYKFRARNGWGDLSHAEVFRRYMTDCKRYSAVTFRGKTKFVYQHLRDHGICPSNFSQFKRDCGLQGEPIIDVLEMFVCRHERIALRKADLRRMREEGMTHGQIYPRG